jgi:hypothetical protein
MELFTWPESYPSMIESLDSDIGIQISPIITDSSMDLVPA